MAPKSNRLIMIIIIIIAKHKSTATRVCSPKPPKNHTGQKYELKFQSNPIKGAFWHNRDNYLWWWVECSAVQCSAVRGSAERPIRVQSCACFVIEKRLVIFLLSLESPRIKIGSSVSMYQIKRKRVGQRPPLWDAYLALLY